MSEEQKPVPCSCGQEAHQHPEMVDLCCQNNDCSLCNIWVTGIEQWNALQTALIELQRQAYVQATNDCIYRVASAMSHAEKGWTNYLAERSAK